MKKIIELLQEAELALEHSLFTDLNKADIKESLTKLQTDIFERWQVQTLEEKVDEDDDSDKPTPPEPQLEPIADLGKGEEY